MSGKIKVTKFNASMALAIVFISPLLAHADTLKDALTKAYVNNPSLEAARASQRVTDETVNQATSGWRPTIEATGSWARQENNRTGSFLSASTTKPKSLGVSIQQPVFRSFQTMNNTNEARKQARKQPMTQQKQRVNTSKDNHTSLDET